MKKIILSILLIIIVGSLLAIPQTEKAAKQVAENFLSLRGNDSQIVDVYEINNKSEKLLYIFNLEQDGFVAIAADNINYPIIAYSFRKGLENRQRGENTLHKMLEADLELRTRYYRENPRKSGDNIAAWQRFLNHPTRETRFIQWPPEGSTSTSGWVESEWNQSGVYYRFCPLDNSNQRSVVGCTATAMSMIMNFHRYVGNPIFTNSDDYISWSESIHIDNDAEERDFPTFPELNEYLQTLAEHYENGTPITDDDKSALCFAAGVSVEMNYSSGGSGAWGVDWPLIHKFGYDSADEVGYDNYNFWARFEDNMKMMRPAEMAIYHADWSSGHAIIADGYNSDNYYHLNFGWGSSNNTCWYLLPNGMPSGYAIISSVVMDIEGGTVPVQVDGVVHVDGVSAVGAEIFLEGERYSYSAIIEEGSIQFQFPAVLEGTYTATAILDSRTYYQQIENLVIDEDNTIIEFFLGNFEAVTGSISAPVAVEDCRISLYQNEQKVYSGVSTGSTFAIADVLPGDYLVTASMNGNYFKSQDVTIVLEDQTFDIELQAYPGSIDLSYAQDPVNTWALGPNYTLSCGVKFSGADLVEMGEDLFTGVSFIAPVDADGNEIISRIWEEENILAEQPVNGYSQGDLVSVEFDHYIIIDPTKEYMVGYTITTVNGDLVYMDNTSRVAGKGAFFKTTNWIELPGTFDGNFCIEAKTVSQSYGKISGTVSMSGGEGNIADVVIKADNYIAHVDASGNYAIFVKPGTINLVACLNEYSADPVSINIADGEELENQNLSLSYGTSFDDPIAPAVTALLGNYPNPFNPSTTISFSIEQNEQYELSIYNLKGQKIKDFSPSSCHAEFIEGRGKMSVTWNGTDDNGKAVSSGIYFYRIHSGDFKASRKMILMK